MVNRAPLHWVITVPCGINNTGGSYCPCAGLGFIQPRPTGGGGGGPFTQPSWVSQPTDSGLTLEAPLLCPCIEFNWCCPPTLTPPSLMNVSRQWQPAQSWGQTSSVRLHPQQNQNHMSPSWETAQWRINRRETEPSQRTAGMWWMWFTWSRFSPCFRDADLPVAQTRWQWPQTPVNYWTLKS